MLKSFINFIKEKFSAIWVIYFVLGIIAINFSDNFIALISLSIAANITYLFFYRKNINSTLLLTILSCVIPLISFSILAMTSKFKLDPNSNYSDVRYVFLILGTLSVPCLGFFSRSEKTFSIKSAIKVIYIALAIWMFINFVITLVQFGPFYTFIYKDRYLFEYGHIARMSIDKTAYMLLGFSVEIVSSEYFVFIASVLSSAILGVFFVSYKEDKRSFFEFLICGCIGLFCLLLTINKSFALCYFFLIVLYTLIILFAKGVIKYNKVTKIILFSIGGLISLMVLVFVLNALNIKFLTNIIENNNFLTRLFETNRIVSRYFIIIRAFADSGANFGFTPYLIGQDSIMLSGSWLFDMIAIAQVFGWVFFVCFVVLLIVRYVQYYKKSSDDKISKILLLGFIVGVLVTSLFRYDSTPYFRNKTYLPLYFTVPFILLMFIFGYIGGDKEEVKDEK